MEDEPQIAQAILADNSLAKKLSPMLEQQMLATLAVSAKSSAGVTT
jgi:hypothetical protein